jgi:signal transduction histidine kinase
MNIPIVLTALLLSASVSASEMPLSVGPVVTGTPSHVRLTNTSTQPVTAWSLAATTQAGGGRTHREVYTVDGYLSEATHGLPGASERLERLLPGQSREIALDPLPSGATVEVVAAVLDDGTAVGDDQILASIFAKRGKERDALRAVVDAFNEVLPTRHGADALAALKERFAALVQREESVPCHAALDAVQTFERKASADEIDRSLRGYADFVKREYDLAARHSQRR